jgi:transposase
VSIGQKTGWNVIHDRRSSAVNVFVLDSKMAKQQLQKLELKFATELEPLEGTSPVWTFAIQRWLVVG